MLYGALPQITLTSAKLTKKNGFTKGEPVMTYFL